MEQYLGQAIAIFLFGTLVGAALVLVFNRVRGGSVSPGKLRKEYDQYQADVENHFEETSKKFQAMTNQYQDLYRHLSVGATSLCRPDSVAAGLADQSDSSKQAPQLDKIGSSKGQSAPHSEVRAEVRAEDSTDAKASSEATSEVKKAASKQEPKTQPSADAANKTESARAVKASTEKPVVSAASGKTG